MAFLGRLYLSWEKIKEASAIYNQTIFFGDIEIAIDYFSLFTTQNEIALKIYLVLNFSGLGPNSLLQHAFLAASNGWYKVNPLESLGKIMDWMMD